MTRFSMTSIVLAGCTLVSGCDYLPQPQTRAAPIYSPAQAPVKKVTPPAAIPAKSVPAAPVVNDTPAPAAAPSYFNDNRDDKDGGGGGGGGWG